MIDFSGNTSGTFNSQFGGELPKMITAFTLVNKTAGTIGVNVYKFGNTPNPICIMPLNKQLASGEIYQTDIQTILLPTENIRIHTSGSLDYVFVVANLQLDESADLL